MRDERIMNGPIGKTLFFMTLPMVFGILAIVAFNLTDTFFVAQLGTDALAAMGFTFPVVLIIGSFTTGLGSGAAAVISQAIGKGDPHEVKRLTAHSLTLGLIFVGALVITGMLTIDPLFHALGAGPATMPLIREYMSYWYPGMFFLIIPMVGNNAIRATGDTKTPSFIMITAAFINVVLDPLLIFGIGPFPKMGIAGAALATIFARATSFTIVLYVLSRKKKILDFLSPQFGTFFNSARRVLGIGLPAAASQLLTPLGMAIFTRLVADYGHEEVAAVGAALRVEAMSMVPLMALATTLMPFIGQNWGARQYSRASSAVDRGNIFAVFWGIGCFLLLQVASGPIASIFSDEAAVLHPMILYMRIVSIGYAAQGMVILVGTAFNATNQPLKSTTVTSIRMMGLFVPLAWLGGQLFGYVGLLYGAGLANLGAGIIAITWQRRRFRIHRQSTDERPTPDTGVLPAEPEL